MTSAFARVRTSRIGIVAAVAVLILDILTKGWAVSALSDGRDIHIFWTLHFALTITKAWRFQLAPTLGRLLACSRSW